MCPLYDRYDSNFICDYCSIKIARNASFKDHKKNFIINSKPRCPLYDKCHIKIEYNMTPISFVITIKTNIAQDASFKNHKKNFIINLEPKVFTV